MNVDPLYLDIETIPTQQLRIIMKLRDKAQQEMVEQLAAVKAPGNYKDQAKIEAYIAEERAKLQAGAAAKFEETIHATGLDGAFCQVAVASIADGDEEPQAIYEEDWQDPRAERRVLEQVNDRLATLCGHDRGRMLVGHHILGFDRKVLRQRGIVHGIRMHWMITKEVKPWDMGLVYDTMIAWSGDPKDRVKLDKLCLAFDIPCKGDLDGSKVWDYVRDGHIREVALYCNDDVRRARAVFKRQMFLGVQQPQPAFDDVPV